MKKWQKIVGVISFGLIGALLAYSISEIEIAYLWYDIICDTNRGFWDAQPYFIALKCLAVSLYFIALALFICLWRKGGKR
mgnify:FL=1